MAHVLGVKLGIGRIVQAHGRRGVRHVWLERSHRRGSGAVVDLVVALAKHPRLGNQGPTTGQVCAVGQLFGRGRAVAGRVEANVQRTRGDGQAVVAAGNGHGSASARARAGSIIVRTQHHIARGHGGGRTYIHVLPCNRCQVAGDDGGGCRQVDIVASRQRETTSGGLGCGGDVDIPHSVRHQAAIGSGHCSPHIDVAQSSQGQRCGRRPGHSLVHIYVAINTRSTAVAQNAHVGSGQTGTQCGASDVAARRNGKVLGINQPGAGFASCRFGCNEGVGCYIDVRGRSFYESTIAAVGSRHVERAAHTHTARLHVTHQQDGALVVLQGLRLNDAGVVNRAAQQTRCRLGGQQDLPTISPDQPAVLHQRIDRALAHRHIEQAIARNVKRDGVARR